MSAVSVLVIDCTTIGAPPPTRTGPTETRAGARRAMFPEVLMLRGFYRCRAWAAPTGTGIMAGPESVCSERVRREPERRRRNSARKRSGTRTADGGALELPRGFWRAVGPRSGPPTEGERRQPRLISQVTGQKGGRRGATRPGRLPLFVVFGRRQAVGRRTALFKLHQELGARMVDFGGWDMPVQYSSQIGEHHAVRRAAGVFDVSHMCIVDLKGAKVRALLEQLLEEGPHLRALQVDDAHVRDVEHARGAAHGVVLADLRAVLHRHVPAAEVDHAGAELLVQLE